MVRTAPPAALAATLLTAVVTLGAPGARAEEIGLSATHTSIYDVRTDNENGKDDDDNFGFIFERLNLGAQTERLQLETRIDANGFIFPPDERYATEIHVERMTARTRLLDVDLDVGDFYEQYGRGIALSIRKLPEAGIDVSVFGTRARLERETFALSAFAGVANTINIDSVSLGRVEDRHDRLAGALFELFPVSGVRVGQYVVYGEAEESLLPDDIDLSLTGGVYLDLPAVVDFASAYLEVLAQERLLAGRPQRGSAAYLQSELHVWDATVLFEGMLLNDFELKGSRNTALGTRFDYNRPPTLERIDQEVINNQDLVGGRVRAEYYFFDLDTLIYGNMMVRLNEPGEASELYQLHGFGGFELRFDDGASRLNFALGHRHEQQPTQTVPVKTLSHFDLDYVQGLGFDVALHLTSNTQWRTLNGRGFFWGSTFAGLEKAGLGGATFELGYDTADQKVGVRNLFYALILAWELDERITVQGIVGNQRGGIKCVAGVCREWPAFSGVRGTLITRF